MTVQVPVATQEDAVSAFVGRWRQGERTNFQEFIQAHPGLDSKKSVVLELAYTELRLRHESGETILPSTFCEQFPHYRRSLRRYLSVCGFVAQDREGWEEQLEKWKEQDEAPCRWPEAGELFLGFEIVEELGKGSFARVYLAKQEELARHVAIKVAKYGGYEAKTLGRLQHENIVPVHSISTDETSGLTAVCMGYYGRATLLDLLDKAYAGRGLPQSADVILRVASEMGDADRAPVGEPKVTASASYVDGIAQLMVQLADALASTHAMGVLHRDIKPTNVLLAPGGVPMLLDFNLSVNRDGGPIWVGGTLEYMAPEVLQATTSKDGRSNIPNDPRSDIFSLGALFYELLTGVVPFGEPEKGQTLANGAREMLALQAAPFRRVSGRNPAVDQELERIVARCLALDVSSRFSSAAELATKLRNYLSPDRRRAIQARRQRSRAIFVSAGVLLIVMGLGAWWRISAATRPTDIEQGLSAYQRGDSAAAIAAFNRHVQLQPQDAKGLFARAQSYLKQGDLKAAENDYLGAAKFSDAGIIRACIAFCLAKQNRHAHAVLWSDRAIEAKFDNAAVRNNQAYSQFRLGHLAAARQSFDLAIEFDPDLLQPRLNRAILGLSEAIAVNRPPVQQALDDIEIALEPGHDSAEIYFHAAGLYARAAASDQKYAKRGEELLYLAVMKGLEKPQVDSNKDFSKGVRSKRVNDLLESPRTRVTPTLEVRLVPLPFDAEIK